MCDEYSVRCGQGKARRATKARCSVLPQSAVNTLPHTCLQFHPTPRKHSAPAEVEVRLHFVVAAPVDAPTPEQVAAVPVSRPQQDDRHPTNHATVHSCLEVAQLVFLGLTVGG